MKKQLIKEAFRLQQLAGIAPVNEIFDTDNDQYMGKYADAYERISVSDDGEYTANDPSDEKAVKLADALTALYDEHGENGVDAWQSGAIDIEDYMESTAEGLQKEEVGGMNRRGNTKTYYVVNRYGVTEIMPYKALGFDGSEQWEEISGFDSDIIKKYYTDNDGTGKVVVDANTSEEEMLADLERIDDDLWM